MRLIVITEVPPAPNVGNLAAVVELYFQTEQPSEENDYKGVVKPLPDISPDLAVAAILNFRMPVFHLGEVILVDEDGREIGGHMRKPSKWDVKFEEFATIPHAAVRAEEVMKL